MKSTPPPVQLINLASFTASAAVWILKQRNSILWHDTVNAWLTRWTGKPE